MAGGDRRSVEITLHSAGGSPSTVYRLNVRGSQASVSTFADVVNRALPAKDAATGRDGEALVQVVADLRSRPRRVRGGLPLKAAVFAAFYVAVLTLMIVAGGTGWALLWGVGSPAPTLGGAILFGFVNSEVSKRRVLRRRGITVVATRVGELGTVFEFTDAEGGEREVRLDRSDYRDAERIGTGPDRIEITYDPLDPEHSASVLTGPARLAVVMASLIGAVLLLGGLFPLIGFLLL
ncbi:hypothetical protein [Actinomadura sp. CNU-125]|uniref:hypothetical protein n=1 Tax=Actinomadura sp. CNU-125 TaxID=1904961 RepID=UPI0011785F7D|nr:hypothetical protein [Actinomadura sp. CNU-125]